MILACWGGEGLDRKTGGVEVKTIVSQVGEYFGKMNTG